MSVPLQLSLLNLDGDEQADLVHHGGRDKAVCVYCVEHYPYWESLTGTTLSFGAFGENVTVGGLTELEAYIGDTFQWGDAIVQISQPRQPCFKLAAKHGWPELPKQVEKKPDIPVIISVYWKKAGCPQTAACSCSSVTRKP